MSRQPVLEELPLPVVKDVDRLWGRWGIVRVAGKDNDWNSHVEEIIVLDDVEFGRHVRVFFRKRPNDWCVVCGEDLVLNAGDSDIFAGEASNHGFEYLEDRIVLRRSAL